MASTAPPVGEKKEQELKKSVRTAIGDNVLEDHRTVDSGSPTNLKEGAGPDDLRVITEAECYDELGFSFPTWKKWAILTVIFWVQVSMNFNTSLYSNGLGGISEEFGVSTQAARCGAMIFLVLCKCFKARGETSGATTH